MSRLVAKTQRFIEKAISIHGNKYDYSTSVYTGTHNNVSIICPIHGIFFQPPSVHASKKACGCPNCARETTSVQNNITSRDFVVKATKVHGTKYDYSKVSYKNNYTTVEIVCPLHGSFFQTPTSHTYMKHGCSQCSNKDKGNSKWMINNYHLGLFYIVKFWNDAESFGKIGITTKQTAKERFIGHCAGYKYEIYQSTNHLPIMEVIMKEVKAKQIISNLRYVPNIKFNGYSECFTWNDDIVQQLVQECI